jgi:hypothetical protein
LIAIETQHSPKNGKLGLSQWLKIILPAPHFTLTPKYRLSTNLYCKMRPDLKSTVPLKRGVQLYIHNIVYQRIYIAKCALILSQQFL